jgi:hypothetical protein
MMVMLTLKTFSNWYIDYMTFSFRHFMRSQPFNCSLQREEAAPAIGSNPSSPTNPDSKNNDHHFDALQQQLGIGDDEMEAALEGDPIQIWKVPDYSSQWGFMVIGPCSGIAKKRPDGNYEITFQLAEKKLMSPKSFIYPYSQGEKPMLYDGEVKDQKMIITPEELQDIMATPFAGGAAPPPPMGGAPGMAPPAPPAGGMPPMGGM